MVRAILGVIIGYLVMAVLVFCTFSIAYMVMRAAGAFRPGTFDPSILWIVTSVILGLFAAIVGGYVCVLISKTKRAPQVLAAIVIVLGGIIAIQALRSTDIRPNVRVGDVSNMEAMQKAKTPGWLAIFNPVVGAAGILVGAGLKTKRDKD